MKNLINTPYPSPILLYVNGEIYVKLYKNCKRIFCLNTDEISESKHNKLINLINKRNIIFEILTL